MIVLDSVTKSFDQGKTEAVKDVSLNVLEGELLVLLGSSGSGKTTLLKMINRLIEPTSGTIHINGQNISDQDPISLRRSIGYVFQGIGLFPHMTVEENIGIGLRLLGKQKNEITAISKDLLETVGLPKDYAICYPDELSGGQQQRVGVARALAIESPYLLMDEPFGALDAITRESLQEELLKLKDKFKKTIVFVTHDIFEALTLADRIAVMHEGNLEQIGTKEELISKPQTKFVRELFEKPARQLKIYTDLA